MPPGSASTPYRRDDTLTLLLGDAVEQMRTLDDGCAACVVTSPPYYGLRDYEGNPDQIGTESTPVEYVAALVRVFAEVHRVLADDGALWLNLGDSYAHGGSGAQGATGARAARQFTAEHVPGCASLPAKNLLGIPWRVAFALQDAGWILRNAIVWHKPNAMPESVTDRLSTRHEMLFLLTKSPRYWFDLDAIREPHAISTIAAAHRARKPYQAPGQTPNVKSRPTGDRGSNPGDVWSISTRPLTDAHFATFPVELPRRCIAAGCKPGGTVLDPFSGAGTTALVAQQLGHPAIGIDINASYHDIALRRMVDAPLPFGEASA
jgi:DNA modification methylase